MKFYQQISDGLLQLAPSANVVDLREDGLYLDGSLYGPGINSLTHRVVDIDVGQEIVFDATHTLNDGVLSVVDQKGYEDAKRRYGYESIRMRDGYLTMSDWTQMPDSPLSAEQKAAWAVYRQALRDIPQQPRFPVEINWPVPPT